MESIISVFQLNGLLESKPSKYPAIDENNTLIARPALVMALKSMTIDFIEIRFSVALNIFG